MKTVPVLAFIAALGGFIFFPLSFEIAVSAIFVAGFVAIAIADYARRVRPLSVRALAPARKERFGLAA